MKFWRPGITGKLFVAIFATCIVLLITMHWAVRVSFERGFIDYIKHGNEQRLQGLSDALGEQYSLHGNWRFLRNNDRFVFQILRSLEHDNDDDRPGPGMPPHGWRTQFWVIDQEMRVLVGPRSPVPPDGTKRAITSNGATVGWVIASPVERLTRNTDINFDRQQRQTSWLIVARSTLLAALATFPLARGLLAPVKRLVEGTHKLAAGDFSTRVDTRSQDELGKLAQDFNQLASTLEKNQQMRRDFMADISHELRTPLALMQAQLELFSAEHPDVRPETAEFLTLLREQTERLTQMTKTLLEMSNLQQVARNEQLQLAPMVEEIFTDLASLAEKRSITLEAEGDAALTGSDALIYRMLFNLTENAVKYNRPGGSVRVELAQGQEKCIIRVSDTGCGIPEVYQRSIFQPFFRVDKSRSREYGGAGLGLSLVWEIADLHGGSVWVEKSSEKGTTIAVELPTQQSTKP